MFLFLESIKLLNGKVYHLDWHQKRVDETFTKCFPKAESLNLKQIISEHSIPQKGLYKMRIIYNATDFQLELVPYTKREINTFEFIEIDFDYNLKSTNRTKIDTLKNTSTKDEVIFTKDNHILDSSYANLAFFDGENWFTPNTYLLNGTTRQRLIRENQLIEIPMRVSQLKNFQKISFINALNDLEENMVEL